MAHILFRFLGKATEKSFIRTQGLKNSRTQELQDSRRLLALLEFLSPRVLEFLTSLRVAQSQRRRGVWAPGIVPEFCSLNLQDIPGTKLEDRADVEIKESG